VSTLWPISIAILSTCILGCARGPKENSATARAASAPIPCRINIINDEYTPEFFVNESALEVPSQNPNLRKVYVAMGCFWGSEALMGSADGVRSTRVGFSGGTLPDPTYSRIGDHAETVEILYDPKVTNFETLIQHFWQNHNARAKPIFRQYASAIFCLDSEQSELARRTRDRWQESSGKERIQTAILPFERFYPAGEAHQKHYLQQDPKLLNGLPADPERLQTRLATKLNSIAARSGERTELEKSLDRFGIDKRAQQALFRRASWPEASP